MSGKATATVCWQSDSCCEMLNGRSVVEQLLIVALDSKGWLDSDCNEALGIIRGIKRSVGD